MSNCALDHTLQKLAHAIYGDFFSCKMENFLRKKEDIFKIYICIYKKTWIVGTH